MSALWQLSNGLWQSRGASTPAEDLETNDTPMNCLEEESQPLLANPNERPAEQKTWNRNFMLVIVVFSAVIFWNGWLSRKIFPLQEAAPPTTMFNGTNVADHRVIRFGNFPKQVLPEKQTRATIKEYVLNNVGGPGKNGYLAEVQNAATHFHVIGSCTYLARTSAIARTRGCRHAVNGGPFRSYLMGGCIGPVIQDGYVANEEWDMTYPTFGVGKDGLWIMGDLTQATYAQYNVTEAVTGFGWLVTDSRPVAPEGGNVAERTAVGVNAKGDLIILQVDGCERCPLSGGPSGLTLSQMAQLLVKHGALHAISLDGGGSSTTVIDGALANRPDCLELGVRCERPVASVVCIS